MTEDKENKSDTGTDFEQLRYDVLIAVLDAKDCDQLRAKLMELIERTEKPC